MGLYLKNGYWLGALALSVVLMGTGRDAHAVTFTSNTLDGANFSFGHSATGAGFTPPGGWKQFRNGTKIFAFDSSDTFDIEYTDATNDGLFNDGDTIGVNAVIDLLDLTGSGFGGKVGTISLDGTLTIGGDHSNNWTNGISGPLNMTVDFIANTTHGGYLAGESIVGTLFYQGAKMSGIFNGASGDTQMIDMGLWGDTRGPANPTVPSATYFGADGSIKNSALAFATDIVVHGEFNPNVPGGGVPEPLSAALGFMGLIGLSLSATRRRR